MPIQWNTAEELIAAASGNSLQESRGLDGKKGLPESSPRGNAEIAKDVSAMTVHGGILVYGIGEDASKMLTVVNAIPLADQKERIDNVVNNGVDPRPEFHVHELPLADGSGNGFLVVEVPLSPLAPHMVTINFEDRFYGRSAAGNVQLSQPEIGDLYKRQAQFTVDAYNVLDEAISQATYEPLPPLGYLHVVVRPVVAKLDRMSSVSDEKWNEIRYSVIEAADADLWRDGNYVELQQDGVDAKKMTTAWHGMNRGDPDAVQFVKEIRMLRSGEVRGFYGAAVWRLTPNGPGTSAGYNVLREGHIARHIAEVFSVARQILESDDYTGPVLVGVGVTGIDEVLSGAYAKRAGGLFWHHASMERGFTSSDFKRADEVSMSRLGDPESLVRELTKHLMEQVSGQADFDPFENRS